MITFIKRLFQGNPQHQLLKQIPLDQGQESLSPDERIYAYVRRCIDKAATEQVWLGRVERYDHDAFAKHRQFLPIYTALPPLAKKAIAYLVKVNPELYFAIMVSHEINVRSLRAALASERSTIESLEIEMEVVETLHRQAFQKSIDLDKRQN